MRRQVWIITLAAVALPLAARAADTKVGGRLYADWHMDLSDGADNANAFELGRTYVDINSTLSEEASVRFTLDLRETGGFDGYNIILKYGFLDWSPEFMQKRAKLRFGLHPTPYIDDANKLWGRRYIAKTPGDENKFLTTSDLGASLIVGFGPNGKWGSGSLSLFNGTSYTEVDEMNKQKNFNGYVILSPLADNEDLSGSQVQAQIYSGTQNVTIDSTMDASDYSHQLVSVGGLLAYRKTFSAGFDLNFYSEGQGAGNADLEKTAHSFFATLYFADLVKTESWARTLNLFGRLDTIDPDTDTDNDGETLLITGVEYAPVKGMKASVNLRNVSYQDDLMDSESYLYLNWLIKI